MARTDAAVEARPLTEIVEEAAYVLRQDFSEYAYIGLIGAVLASMSVLVPGIIGDAPVLALIGPLVVIAAVLTFATSTAALCVGANQLQPDAAGAFRATLGRAPGVLFPWLPLAGGLTVAGYAGASFAGYLGPVPHVLIPIALVAACACYAFPRSMHAAAMFDQELPSRLADAASAAIVAANTRRVLAAWALAGAPAFVSSALGVVAGFDFVSGALVVFLFVAALPFAAATMSLIFFDIASRVELAPSPRSRSVAPAARRRA